MQKSKWNLYITGAILILMGILSLRYPVEAMLSVGTMIGIGLCISGLNYFSGFYFFRRVSFIFLGILDLFMGILMISRPGISAFLIPFVIASWLALTGFMRIGTSMWLGGAKIKGWWLMLINGIALIFFAALMCASPLTSALSVIIVLAIELIISGILVIIEGRIIF